MFRRAVPSPRRAIAVALVTLFAAAPARAEVRPLTLYQKAGRAPFVVVTETVDADDRFASLKVVEVVKGDWQGPSIRVVYRLENFLRKSWMERLDFVMGERAIHFLRNYETDREDGKIPEDLRAPDILAPAFGAQSRFPLPAEGEAAYLEAIRLFAKVAVMTDAAAQDDAVVAFLDAANPHVLQAGLEQTVERRLAGPAQVPRLLELIASPREGVRLNALQALGQLAEDLQATGGTLPDRQDVVNRLKGEVLGAGPDVARAEALKVVAALGGEGERPFLERLAKEDPSQLVRYEATRALIGLGPGGKAPQAAP